MLWSTRIWLGKVSLDYDSNYDSIASCLDWFDYATAILKEIQDKVRQQEEAQVRKDREPYLKVLRFLWVDSIISWLTILGVGGGVEKTEGIGGQVGGIFDRRVAEVVRSKTSQSLIDSIINVKLADRSPRSDVKKALSKLILLYHPDHVDIKEHGGKYFVLCEEITKALTKKYEFFKWLIDRFDFGSPNMGRRYLMLREFELDFLFFSLLAVYDKDLKWFIK